MDRHSSLISAEERSVICVMAALLNICTEGHCTLREVPSCQRAGLAPSVLVVLERILSPFEVN